MVNTQMLTHAFTKAKAYRKQGRKGVHLLVNTPVNPYTHFVLGYDDNPSGPKNYVIGLKCGHVYTTYLYKALYLPAIVTEMNKFIETYS